MDQITGIQLKMVEIMDAISFILTRWNVINGIISLKSTHKGKDRIVRVFESLQLLQTDW